MENIFLVKKCLHNELCFEQKCQKLANKENIFGLGNKRKGLKMIFANRSKCYLYFVANQHRSVPRTESVSQECAVHYYFKI
jgi:hypothetical protein